jgi:hypothetical protein
MDYTALFKPKRGKGRPKGICKTPEDMFNNIKSKYGQFGFDLFTNWQQSPELTMKDVGDLLGISREAVRQKLNKIYGTTAKPTLTLRRCRIRKTSNPWIIEILAKANLLKKVDLTPNKNRRVVASDGTVFILRKLQFHKTTESFHVVNRTKDADFVIVSLRDDIYMVPFENSFGYHKLEYWQQYEIEQVRNSSDY